VSLIKQGSLLSFFVSLFCLSLVSLFSFLIIYTCTEKNKKSAGAARGGQTGHGRNWWRWWGIEPCADAQLCSSAQVLLLMQSGSLT
jgi:hypothetical protein